MSWSVLNCSRRKFKGIWRVGGFKQCLSSSGVLPTLDRGDGLDSVFRLSPVSYTKEGVFCFLSWGFITFVYESFTIWFSFDLIIVKDFFILDFFFLVVPFSYYYVIFLH